MGHGAVFFALMLAGLVLLALIVGIALPGPVLIAYAANHPHKGQVLVLALPALVVSVCCILPLLLAVRRVARQTRRLAGDWCGVPVADPYPPQPAGLGQRIRWLLTDRATWRDLLWPPGLGRLRYLWLRQAEVIQGRSLLSLDDTRLADAIRKRFFPAVVDFEDCCGLPRWHGQRWEWL